MIDNFEPMPGFGEVLGLKARVDILARAVRRLERELADALGRNARHAALALALEFYADPVNWTHNKDPRGGYGPRAAADDGERARLALGIDTASGLGGWRD